MSWSGFILCPILSFRPVVKEIRVLFKIGKFKYLLWIIEFVLLIKCCVEPDLGRSEIWNTCWYTDPGASKHEDLLYFSTLDHFHKLMLIKFRWFFLFIFFSRVLLLLFIYDWLHFYSFRCTLSFTLKVELVYLFNEISHNFNWINSRRKFLFYKVIVHFFEWFSYDIGVTFITPKGKIAKWESNWVSALFVVLYHMRIHVSGTSDLLATQTNPVLCCSLTVKARRVKPYLFECLKGECSHMGAVSLRADAVEIGR